MLLLLLLLVVVVVVVILSILSILSYIFLEEGPFRPQRGRGRWLRPRSGGFVFL